MKPKYILFDCFGTVFNMENIPKEDLRYYGKVLRAPIWEPLNFPEYWSSIPAHSDSKEGLDNLKFLGFTVVALSNAPKELMTKLSKYNSIQWDYIIGLEKFKIYKPNPLAYLTACAELDCKPSECLMVTANETFGDLENSKFVGMNSKLIRNNTGLNILSLSKELTIIN